MIKAVLYREGKNLTGCRLEGHSGWADQGHDIVCAAASILGYVGAGGLGLLIDERIGWRDYNGLGTVLLMLFILVVSIESLSQYLRKKLS